MYCGNNITIYFSHVMMSAERRVCCCFVGKLNSYRNYILSSFTKHTEHAPENTRNTRCGVLFIDFLNEFRGFWG